MRTNVIVLVLATFCATLPITAAQRSSGSNAAHVTNLAKPKAQAKKAASKPRPAAQTKKLAPKVVPKKPAVKKSAPKKPASQKAARPKPPRHIVSLNGRGTGAMALKRWWARVDDLSYLTHAQFRRLGKKLLVPVRDTLVYQLDPRPEQHKGHEGEEGMLRSWAKQFLDDLARAHYLRFQRPLQVNSAFRCVEHHRALRRGGNRNSARGLSPHSTGATFDITRLGMSAAEEEWMEGYLTPREESGEIEVTREVSQAVYDIMVRKPQGKAAATD